jgi:soluble lytic murein transglycosylase-like protein
MRFFRGVAAAAVLTSCAIFAPLQAQAGGMRPLTPEDAQIYASAFDSAQHGDYDVAETTADKASDKCLLGYVEMQKLMRPSFSTPFVQLAGWLGKYADLAGAEKIFSLAKKRAPAGADLPAIPDVEQPLYVSARDAFYSGDTRAAHTLAISTGEHWIAGLSAFRMKSYAEARSHFEKVMYDADQDDGMRAGAAYWAARSAIAQGQPEAAPDYLRIAARADQTFYGMIAERQLGLEQGAASGALPYSVAAAPEGSVIKAAYQPMTDADAERLLQSDARARRAAALIQVGRTEEAAAELKRGILDAKTDAERQLWSNLALALNAQAAASRPEPKHTHSYDPADYPAPDLTPQGGFTLDKAMVYALVRQESRFNPQVVSYAGAIGLMQVRPGTASDATGDGSYKRDPRQLYDPSVNLRAGQDYLSFLMNNYTGGDMLRTVAAYNGGPGAVLKAERNGGMYDPLMVIESLPAQQTRAYVQEVMASYWTYRRMFGEHTRSIDALGSGERTVDVRLDR